MTERVIQHNGGVEEDKHVALKVVQLHVHLRREGIKLRLTGLFALPSIDVNLVNFRFSVLLECHPGAHLGINCFPFVFCVGSASSLLIVEVAEGSVHELLVGEFVFQKLSSSRIKCISTPLLGS